jgi:hypothetical protein
VLQVGIFPRTAAMGSSPNTQSYEVAQSEFSDTHNLAGLHFRRSVYEFTSASSVGRKRCRIADEGG